MKAILKKLSLSLLAMPLLATILAAAEEFQMQYNGHTITVKVITYDPECGHKLLIVESPVGREIGTYIFIPPQ